MKGFTGFPQKGRLTKIPGLFFSDLLPQIDNLAELKVTLYCFWRLQQKEGQAAYVREGELAGDGSFMAGLGKGEADQKSALREGLERSTTRGTLLRVALNQGDQAENFYFVNTARGRAMAQGLAAGRWQPEDDPLLVVSLSIERPNIFTLYEQNIGPLTPMIGERLTEVEASYPAGWVDEAIEIAIARNKRNLSYVEGILKRWQAEGRGDKNDQIRDEDRYVSGKYRDEINY